MVLSRNDKRKRKEGDLVDLMEPLSETSKRTKVHAQRKFAQGASTVFSPSHTPIKDKEKSKPPVITELITHKRPNTEDFLTYLCFRGTSILPPSLNFFNVGAKKEKIESKQSNAAVPSKSQTTSSQSASNQKAESNQKTITKVKPIIAEKKVSSVIQKKITKFKSTTSTVQALKKKYQEQRLAKQRIKNKFKSSSVMRTRSCTERAILKVGGQLAPRKFLPRIETKRLGLRSGVLRDAVKKASPKCKVLPMKPKKKIVKQQECTDSSESDLSSSSEEEEEELPSEKSNNNVKRTVQQKQVAKNMCTRSKSESRRITRSHSGTVSNENSSKRPTRKTKEAAAAYMEILGRKLLSPAAENDDNASTESFSESPTTRRTGNGESEVKSKMKQTVKTVTKTRSCKATSFANTPNKRLDKNKNNKMVFKSKRLVKVQKYCEIESDEESESSVETNNTRPVTRRSVGKVNKPVVRHLRSASKNLITRVETQNTISAKGKTQIQTSIKTTKEKFLLKRKREVSDKPAPGKSSETKQKEAQNNVNKESESDEETLGMLLNKLKRKKDIEEEEKADVTEVVNSKEKQKQISKERAVKLEITKISDDEESFHGFTKKTITNIMTTSQTCTTPSNLVKDEANIKADKTKTVDLVESPNMKETPEKNETAESSHTLADLEKTKSIKNCKPINVPTEIKLDSPPRMNEERKHAQKITVSTTNIVDVTLSTLHMRKEKVNMSTEQIEKWLNESTFAKEESKLEMENMSNFKYDICEKKTDTSHLSISTKIQHLVRPVNVTLSKLSEKLNMKDRTSFQNKSIGFNLNDSNPLFNRKQECTPIKQNKIALDIKDSMKGKHIKPIKDSSPGEDDTLSKSDQNSLDGSVEKKLTTEKKPIFQPRKPFLPKVKERKTVVPNVNAFSPENESSVYAFESDTEVPVSTPFRRKAREQNKIAALNSASEGELTIVEEQISKPNSETSEVKEKVPRIIVEKIESDSQESRSTSVDRSKFELPKSFGTLANIQVLPLDKLTTSWSNVNCSASIAVQVNLDDSNQEQLQGDETATNQHRSTEISTQTENSNENDDENDGQLFYIPLQAVTRGGPNLVQGHQLIQGVAVKLGTDGPNGPNQKVLLRAKLVTKPPSSIARCPPVGTVQPTTRTPPTNNVLTGITEQSVPSTSAIVTPSTAVASTEPILGPPLSTEHTTAQPSVSTTAVLVEKLTKSPKGSRERKMSVDSTKNTKRCPPKSKLKNTEICSPTNNVAFPSAKSSSDGARLVEAPTFHPTEKDFQDPLDYIDKIRPVAEKFGICRVVPPSNFKPECKVSDDMRFTAYNQYVHRMLHRWGPNVKEMMAIKKYLATQSITLSHPPWIGGMEVDLPHLYQTVQSLGGLKEVIEKKKWQKVADGMKIPKSAQDRVTKLDDIYCKYLLPYDTLSPEERDKLFNEVEAEWTKRETRVLQRHNGLLNDTEEDDEDDSSDEIDECIVKGRNMPLNAFYRIARNTQRMWFGENQRSGNETDGASAADVENAFWKHVAERKRHVCVHAASIDSSGRGFGFSVAKNSPFARHPWNLKVLTNNAGSVLRALGPIMGVTVPTLHVGMLFSACCWYRDPHGLPWIEYLHTGAKKIWYGIPDEHNNNFKTALSKMVPRYCKNKIVWLPSDTAMVPPDLLVSNGVSLCQTVQEPGQFIIVFPKAFTSSICTGYVVSESVYFAQPSWLETAEQVFKDIQDSCEPSIFSFERLLFNIINDSRSHIDVLKQILPSVTKIREKEISYRKELEAIGLTNTERLPLPDSGKRKKGKKVKEDDGDFECETCRANLFVSLVNNSQDDSVYCLTHGLQLLAKKKQILKHCTLMYTYDEDELDELIHRLEDRIEAKSKKTNQIKQAK